MSTGVVLDERFELHEGPPGHPERPERLRAIRAALDQSGLLAKTTNVAAVPCARALIERVHRPHYLDQLFADIDAGSGYLDADTFFSPGTREATLLASGALVELTRAVLDGTLTNGIAFVRPPGHHATAERAMGFCLINHVAVAAAEARARGVRVAIFDFDVHHGNGTQDIFAADPNVLYLSTHEWPQYPGTGAAAEIGVGAGLGATVNVPLPAETGDAAYLLAYRAHILPALQAFNPELLLCSAGFDAHARDPLGGLSLSTQLFADLADDLVQRFPRAVFALEGGYDLTALAECAVAVLSCLVLRAGVGHS